MEFHPSRYLQPAEVRTLRSLLDCLGPRKHQCEHAYHHRCGTIVIAANQAGNADYSAAPQVTRSIIANQASETITFAPLPSPVIYGVAPITLSATGEGSGNPVTFSVLSGPGSVSGSTLTIAGVGTVVVAANQAGNTNYTAAPQVTQSMVVNSASRPTLTLVQKCHPKSNTTNTCTFPTQ